MTRNTLGRSCLLEANLILVAGVTNTYRLRWLRRVTDRQGATVARPMDLTGWTPIMQIRRGNRITVGDGDPGEPPADALAGDVYINQANGDFYQVQDQ